MSAEESKERYGESISVTLSPFIFARDAEGKLDSRFDALRPRTRVGLGWSQQPDYSLGAIVRAAAACGLAFEMLPPWSASEKWIVTYRTHPGSVGGSLPGCFGNTPEEATARALVAAVAVLDG